MSSEARTLAAADALAIAIATGVAFVFRATVREFDSLGPGHLASLIFPALPFTIGIGLLALWSAGLYGSRAARARGGALAVASALGWAAAALVFIGVSWDRGPEAPFVVTVVGYLAAVALVLAGRHLLEARAPTAVPR
jgi:hypothetical protein